MSDKIIIKKGRVRIKEGHFGIYTIECRLNWWLPFWWDMGHTTFLNVAENHIKWIEENIVTAKAPTPMPEGMNIDNRPKAPAAPPSKAEAWREQERKDLIDENLALHEELFKAREEIKKLQNTIQRLGNKLAKERK